MKEVGRNLNKSEQFSFKKMTKKEAAQNLKFMTATLLAVIVYRRKKTYYVTSCDTHSSNNLQ